jgi:6,7-dimethyl-8-ribityllumazine synthase
MKTESERMPVPALPGVRVLLVVAPYYRDISQQLERGARAVIEQAEAQAETLVVPGAFEIPGAIAQVCYSSAFDAFVALGCVVRGETSHYDYVCGESARALMELSLQGIPVGYGILTVDTIEQARVRADITQGDKGGEAALAALTMLAIKRRFVDADA